MTNRKFIFRKKKYFADIKFNRKTAAFAMLQQQQVIQIIFNKSKVICLSNFYYSLDHLLFIKEPIEIVIRKDTICNNSTSFVLSKVSLELLEECDCINKYHRRNNIKKNL